MVDGTKAECPHALMIETVEDMEHADSNRVQDLIAGLGCAPPADKSFT